MKYSKHFSHLPSASSLLRSEFFLLRSSSGITSVLLCSSSLVTIHHSRVAMSLSDASGGVISAVGSGSEAPEGWVVQ